MAREYTDRYNLIDIYLRIKEHPQMFLRERDLDLLKAFISGFLLASPVSAMEREFLQGFSEYCSKELNYRFEACDWLSVIRDSIPKEKEWDAFFQLFDGYMATLNKEGNSLMPMMYQKDAMSQEHIDSHKLFDAIMRIKDCPHPYFEKKDLCLLDTFITGFRLSTPASWDWDCLSGFNHFCSKRLNHTFGGYGWVNMIRNSVSEKEEWDTFFQLFDEFTREQRSRGIPMTPLPHFELGGIYTYSKNGLLYYLLILGYDKGWYLIAVTEADDSKDIKPDAVRSFSVGWCEAMGMIYPVDTELVGRTELRGDFDHIGRIPYDDNDACFIEMIANEAIWENKGVVQFDMSLEDISKAEVLNEQYQQFREVFAAKHGASSSGRLYLSKEIELPE